ncbi:IS21 family transposase [Pseudochryseolinea flava]|nr:IS21 family transposase [Pseudochryseolinea flava]
MHQIKTIIELQLHGRSIRQIVRLTGLSRNTVRDYLRRMSATGMSSQELLSLDDESLSSLVYVDACEKSTAGRSIDDRHSDLKKHLEYYCSELKKRGVTKQLLWEEYRKVYPDGYRYTQFCAYLNQHLKLDEAVMYFTHQPAESSQIDFAGKKLSYVDRSTGECIECESLVCVLPFSHYMYVEAILSQKQEHFIPALGRFKKFIGGVTTCVKMDNMRTAVQRASRYEPVFTEAMEYFAAHYGTTAVTARVGKPRDKGSVEKAVDLAYKHIYAPLRNQVFHSLEELNAAIRRQLDLFNSRPFKNKTGSRKELFEQHEKPLLKPLPSSVYEIKHTTDSKVQRNYHVVVGEDRHQYSVPHTLIGKKLKIIYTSDTVEVYDGLKRVAIHKRSYRKYGHTTNIEHRPVNHQKVIEQRAWDDEYFLRNASYIGQSVQQVVKRILSSNGFYEQTYNSCLGILRLGKQYGNARLDAACKRALSAARVNYGMVENILKNNLDRAEVTVHNNIPDHNQIRGSKDYQ